MSFEIFAFACMTVVVASRLSILGSDRSVSSRHRYAAIWQGTHAPPLCTPTTLWLRVSDEPSARSSRRSRRALAHDEADGDHVVVQVGHKSLSIICAKVQVDTLLVQRRPRADAHEISARGVQNARATCSSGVTSGPSASHLLMQDRDAGLRSGGWRSTKAGRRSATACGPQAGRGQVGVKDDLLVGAVAR